MKIADIIAQENHHTIKLYKQGVFWVAYEQSAYAIWKNTGYKASKKYIKSIAQSIVSVGFPDTSLKKWQFQKKETLLEGTEKYKCFLSSAAWDNSEYESWKNNTDVFENREVYKEKRSMEEAIKNFPLEKKTPIEAFLFIEELKKNMKKYNNGSI